MKRLLIILSVIVLGCQQSIAQEVKLEAFRTTVLPQYSTYFSQAGITGRGVLSLTASGSYTGLAPDEKVSMLGSITKAWGDSLVMVQYGSKREIWGRSQDAGSAQLLDTYDLNEPPPKIPVRTNLRSHPWFFYVGGQFGGDNNKNINLAINLRGGFFLLMNRWDLAATLSGGGTVNTATIETGGKATTWVNTGLMTRVHFPIKKIGLSPNVGAEVTVSEYADAPATVNAAFVVGLSWYVGIGSLDVGISLGNVVSGSAGYTLSPSIRRK